MTKKSDYRINTYIFPPSTIDKMKKAINKTHKTYKEKAFSLCLDKKTNEVHTGKEHSQSGETANVKFVSDCEKPYEHIGTFHTHIKSDSTQPSALDVHNNCHEYNKIDCIGSPKDGKVMCMEKINPNENCQHKVKSLVFEEDVLITINEGDERKLYSDLDKIINENFRVTELKPS